MLALRASFKIDRAHANSALFDASTAATAKICSFQNVYVNNQANLWIIAQQPALPIMKCSQSNDASRYAETRGTPSLESAHPNLFVLVDHDYSHSSGNPVAQVE
jgi:hypothetical protein